MSVACSLSLMNLEPVSYFLICIKSIYMMGVFICDVDDKLASLALGSRNFARW